MPETEQQDEPVSERVVKEAVRVGLETPMREPILEAVEEADGSAASMRRRLPLAGALLALGGAVGYLVGSKGVGVDSARLSIDELEAPEVITDVADEHEPREDEVEATAEEADVEIDTDEESGGSRLRRLVIALGIVGAIALLRRRFASSDVEEWEPIEEFEPAVSVADEPSDTGEVDEPETESEEEATPSGNDELEE